MFPYPIEPHNPWSKTPRKKSLVELLEEETLFHQLVNTHNSTISAGHPNSYEYYDVSNLTPSFTATPTSSFGPSTVTFNNTSQHPVNIFPSYIWKFGDGQTSVDKQPVHVYSNTGSYDVELSILNLFGISSSIRIPSAIIVNKPSVSASFLMESASNIGPVTVSFFNATINTSQTPNTTCRWNFGNGQTSTLNTPTAVYETGSFIISLEVTGSYNLTSTFTSSITISVPSLIPQFTYNTESNVNSNTIIFQNSTDYNGHDTPTYLLEFGDGNVTTTTNTSHVYDAGSYTASLHATGSYNIKEKYTASFIVTLPPEQLALSISSSIVSAIAGITPSTESYRIFSSVNNDTKTYIRNSVLWLTSSIDLTCIPAYVGNNPNFDGVLIAPDILLEAAHAHSSGIAYFVTQNNQTISSSVVSGSQVGTTDIWISKLSPPLTSNIKPAKILPSSSFVGNNLKITNAQITTHIIPAVMTNPSKEIRLGMISQLDQDVYVIKPTNSNLINWYTPIISGDSGSPLFLLINDELIVLGTWYMSDLISFSIAPSVSSFETQINQTIQSLGSTSSLSKIDLSSFFTY